MAISIKLKSEKMIYRSVVLMGKSETKSRHAGKTLGMGLLWSSKNIGLAVKTTLVTSYLSFYATDVLGMAASLIGSILLGCKLFDGVTDLFAGWLIDNTRTRLGKARPYEWSILFCGIFTILLFSTPHFGMAGKAIWLAVMYVLTEAVFATLINTSDPIYLLRAFPEEEERSSVYSISVVISQAISMALGVLLPSLIATAGTSQTEWTRMVLLLVGPTALIGMIRFFFIREKYVEPAEKRQKTEEAAEQKKKSSSGHISAWTGLKAIGRNKYLLLLMLMIIIIIICSGLINTAGTYYFKYFVGDIGKMSVVNFAMIASVVMLIIFVPLSNKIGKCRVLQIGLILASIGCVVRVAGGTSMVTLVLGMSLVMFGIMPISLYFPLYLFDIIDYGEWKTGDRVEGMMAALPAFATKIANGLSVSLASFILGAAGYNGKLAVQSASAMHAIELTYNYIPLICMVIMTIISLIWFNMDKDMPAVKQELAERHKKEELENETA